MYIRCTMMINFIQQNKELAKLIQKIVFLGCGTISKYLTC